MSAFKQSDLQPYVHANKIFLKTVSHEDAEPEVTAGRRRRMRRMRRRTRMCV